MDATRHAVAVWRQRLRSRPGRIVLRTVAVLVGTYLTLTVAYGVALIQVCDDYERRGLLDCGGADGGQRMNFLGIRYFVVLLLAEVLALFLWRRRRKRR